VSDDINPHADDLRQVEQRADEIAANAAEARDENERGTRRGQETDYDFRLPPDVAEADRVRARDEVDLNARQEDAAETQRLAAETLRRNAETLGATGDALDRTARAVHQNRRDVGEIRENVDDLRDQLAQARDQVNGTDVPRVDDGGNGDGGSADR
jgi:hypothetical protein